MQHPTFSRKIPLLDQRNMKTQIKFLIIGAVTVAFAITTSAQLITDVTQVNGRTDRPSPQWTGQSFGLMNFDAVVGLNYTVTRLGEDVLAMNDRFHEYNGASTTLPLPSYLLNQEYIMTANDNRDQNAYQMNITVSSPVRAYLLVDNRIGDGDTSDPPNLVASPDWAWIASNWQPVITGANRTVSLALPDEFGWDESGDGVAIGQGNSLAQWGSIYYRDFPAGTFSTYTQSYRANMYGLVIAPIPEPYTGSLLALMLGLMAFFRRR